MTPRQIKGLRKQRGQTQVALAEEIGVSPNTVARWERGELKPTRKSIAVLSSLLEGPRRSGLREMAERTTGTSYLPCYVGSTEWVSPDGFNYWRPVGRPVFVEVVEPNPYDWERRGEDVWSARLFVGLSVGDKPCWVLNDVVKLVVHHWKLPASFLSQRGIWGRPPGLVVEDSVQIVIVSTELDPAKFQAAMVELAERLAKDLEQEEIVLELQRNGITASIGGVVPPRRSRPKRGRPKRRRRA